MFRFVSRFLGLWLLAGAVVAAVIDGSKSIAASRFVMTTVGEAWFQVHRNSLGLAQAALERHVSPVLWDPVVVSILFLPLAVVLLVIASLLLAIGKPKRDILSTN
jgi:hypothetical protein